MRSALRAYVGGHHHKVQGWLDDFSARLIVTLAIALDDAGRHGAAVEIGVHHGRLFILLHLASTGRKDLVIDVFDEQELNVDDSGKGDKAIFLKNLARFGGDPACIDIFQRSSLTVRPGEITERVGAPLMFSIDGGHTAECALNDLRLADASLSEHGFVVLDDFFNEFWPEVAVGTTMFLSDPAACLRPFAVSPGKVYLCRPGQQEFFHRVIQQQFSRRYVDKSAQMFGSPVLVVGVRDTHRSLLKRLVLAVLDSDVGRRMGAHRLLPSRFAEAPRVDGQAARS
jgi:hypothetical protein